MTDRATHGIAAIILAAGLSSRMAPGNKMLARDGYGQSMIGRVIQAALGTRTEEVILITGHRAEEIEHAARQATTTGTAARLRFVRSPNYAQGMSASVKAGIAAAARASAALICLGDMPEITAAMMNSLIDAYDPAAGKTIVVPTCRGARGNPVLWGNALFDAFGALSGDTGARALLALHASNIIEVELATEALLTDFDTPQSLVEGGWTQ